MKVYYSPLVECLKWCRTWVIVHVFLTCKELQEDCWKEHYNTRPKVTVMFGKSYKEVLRQISVAYPERAKILRRDYFFGLVKVIVLGIILWAVVFAMFARGMIGWG